MTIRPLTPSRGKELEALFGERGASGGCWCMFWRRPRAAFVRQKGGGNRRALGARIGFREVARRSETRPIMRRRMR